MIQNCGSCCYTKLRDMIKYSLFIYSLYFSPQGPLNIKCFNLNFKKVPEKQK